MPTQTGHRRGPGGRRNPNGGATVTKDTQAPGSLVRVLRGTCPASKKSLADKTGNMDTWEYTTLDILKRRGEVDELNRLGRDGWEAVAMVSSWGLGWRFVHPIVLLKRQLPAPTS